MKSVVTGGAGFIGSNLTDKLLELGHEVIVIDNESSKSNNEYHWNTGTKNYKIDLSDTSNIDKITEIFESVNYVFHMASDVSIPYCIENPIESYLNNVKSTCNILEASRKSKVERVILSSTSAIYGLNDKICVETDTPSPLNPYSNSKLSSENLMSMYYSLYGVKTVSLRYFNVYGKRQPSKGQYAPVMGIFFQQKKSGKSLTIIGDGNQTRDFVHVFDVVDANIKVALNDASTYGQVYNVGTSKNFSIKSIASMISDDHIYLEPRPAEVRHSIANTQKIKSVYDWTPKIDLEKWIKENV